MSSGSDADTVEASAETESAATEVNGSKHAPFWARLGAIAFAITVSVVIFAYSEQIAELKTLGYLGAFLIMLVGNATLVLPVPGLILIFLMGETFNPVLLALCAGPGAALGELTGYLAGFGGVAPVENTRLYRRFERWMERFGPLVIFLLAIVPNPVFDMAGVVAGSYRMPVWQFLTAAWLGKTIQVFLIAVAGHYSLGWVADLLER